MKYVDPLGLTAMSWAFPLAGGAAAADGPAPFGDLLGLGLLGAAYLYDQLTDEDDYDDPEQCEDTEDCDEEIRDCKKLCRKAQYDPDLSHVWGGSWARCMLGCVSWRCMDQLEN